MGWGERSNPVAIAQKQKRKVDMWLDDVRPAPDGWLHVTTIQAAKEHLYARRVRRASLDHDLGACEACMGGLTVTGWLERNDWQTMPHCEHVGTGYQLCVWMAEHGYWPDERPTVHSANPVGRDRMRGVIARYFPETANAAAERD